LHALIRITLAKSGSAFEEDPQVKLLGLMSHLIRTVESSTFSQKMKQLESTSYMKTEDLISQTLRSASKVVQKYSQASV